MLTKLAGAAIDVNPTREDHDLAWLGVWVCGFHIHVNCTL
jgi:hypothetical protein